MNLDLDNILELALGLSLAGILTAIVMGLIGMSSERELTERVRDEIHRA